MPDIFGGNTDQKPVKSSSSKNDAQSSQPELIESGFDAQLESGDKSSQTTTTSSDTPPAVSRRTQTRQPEDYSEVVRTQGVTTNPLEAFATMPSGTHFDVQEQNEKVILLLRRHPATQVRWVVTAILLALVPLLLSFLPGFQSIEFRFQLAGLLIWYLLITGFALESFLSWFYNVYILTDERVVDVDFFSLIYKNISSAKIDNIEDVTSVAGGALAALFDYGTVVIQTAGAKQQFDFEQVPHPDKVIKLVNELLLEEEREKIEGRVN